MNLKRSIKKILPEKILNKVLPAYHLLLAWLGAVIYKSPSKDIKVVAVTGTKGKTSTVEMINAILEEAGFKTALGGTIRFKVGQRSKDNLYKMTMPGRFFTQKFLNEAVEENCGWAVIEMTSEGSKQYRHKFIHLDALVVTNISPEHIESHGSYENYIQAKVNIGKALEKSKKERKVLVLNKDNNECRKFLPLKVENKYVYSLSDAEPYKFDEDGLEITLEGVKISSKLVGKFNAYNMLAAAAFARSQNIDIQVIKKALEKLGEIKGRVEKIDKGQDFEVIVDYAHTPDSLENLYQAFPESRKICVLGNAGGGRDKWKREIMGSLADKYCTKIILTDEDPYDEDPRKIVEEMKVGIKNKKPEIIMDRRKAIGRAIDQAKKGDVVLISGKGTDPYIMGPSDSKIPWSDAKIASEELSRSLKIKKRKK